MKNELLVLGAGGFLGLNTVRALLDAGLRPRCGRRARGNVLGLRGLDVPLVQTEFDHPKSLEDAMHGVDTVVHLAAHYPKFSTDLEGSVQRGLRELEVVLEAAAQARIRRLVFVSSTATVAPRADGPSTEADVFSSRPTWGTYHALKWSLEARLAEETRFDVSIACPAACLGPYDWKVGTSALVLATALGQVPPFPRGRISTVDARDVALALVKLSQLQRCEPRVILSADTFDAGQLFALLATRYGVAAPGPALSAEAACAFADADELAAQQAKRRPKLARELVDLIIHAPALDTSHAHRLGLRFRALNDTLFDWETWARRMGLFPKPTAVQAHDP